MIPTSPSKFGTDGSQIAALYEAREIKRIRDCYETNVLTIQFPYVTHTEGPRPLGLT